jgi:hypothetical protein
MDAERWRTFFGFFFFLAMLAMPSFLRHHLATRHGYRKFAREREEKKEIDRTTQLMEAMYKTNVPPEKILKVLNNGFDDVIKKDRE